MGMVVRPIGGSSGGDVTIIGPLPLPVEFQTPQEIIVTNPVDVSDSTIAVSNFPVSQLVTGPLTDAELRATPVPVNGTVSVTEPVTVDAVDLDIRDLVFATDKVDVSGSSVSALADVVLPEANIGYTDGDITRKITQTSEGFTRVLAGGLVSETPKSYLSETVMPLSLNSEGRLRVSTLPALINLDFFAIPNLTFGAIDLINIPLEI
jgi:hypothetical protein